MIEYSYIKFLFMTSILFHYHKQNQPVLAYLVYGVKYIERLMIEYMIQ